MFLLFRSFVVLLVSGLLFAVSHSEAEAVTLDLAALGFEAEASPFLSSRGQSVYSGSLYTLTANPSYDPLVNITSSASIDPTLGTTVLNGSLRLDVAGTAGAFSGESVALRTDVNLIEILFNIKSDTTGLLGSHVAVSILHFGDASRSVDVFSNGNTSDSSPLEMTKVAVIGPVPLPASVFMLLCGIGFIAAAGRRTSARNSLI